MASVLPGFLLPFSFSPSYEVRNIVTLVDISPASTTAGENIVHKNVLVTHTRPMHGRDWEYGRVIEKYIPSSSNPLHAPNTCNTANRHNLHPPLPQSLMHSSDPCSGRKGSHHQDTRSLNAHVAPPLNKTKDKLGQ
ncbi:Hypothetical predicted protein [Podarcis lilfordi]|uniref:Uncharacterized protein n=1 Tax=Podarcis lilfordi TaxID=74358 RepID=A0AA35JPB8_9SAUR|nr:Hypothetical predicted protein [Podarcis lilfordi]